MQITLTQGQISDLFFNHDHPNWARVMADDEMEGITWEDAIRPDAVEFAAIVGNQVDVEWLVKDFVARV